jgi:hypothetical protein
MARQTIVLQVFVASPSDVSEERTILETVIAQLNQVWSHNLGITFELLKWETNVHPAFSTDPQSTINQQIGIEYDVFIGIFWGRLGTPTPRANSGTIEEFELAYARFQKTGNTPEIMLYFKDAPISPSRIDVEQLQSVLMFKNSLAAKGGLYSVFEDQAGFEPSLRAHLSSIAQNYAVKQRSLMQATHSSDNASARAETIDIDEDYYGYMDYFEIYETRQAEMISAITLINEATVRIGEQLHHRSAEILGEAAGDAKVVRRFVKRAADDMNSYADTLKNQVTILSTSRESAFNALSNALALQDVFKEGYDFLRQMLFSLIEGTETAKNGMVGMRDAADSLPRISKELNKARHAVVSQLDMFLMEVDSTRSTVVNIIESIDRMPSASGIENSIAS